MVVPPGASSVRSGCNCLRPLRRSPGRLGFTRAVCDGHSGFHPPDRRLRPPIYRTAIDLAATALADPSRLAEQRVSGSSIRRGALTPIQQSGYRGRERAPREILCRRRSRALEGPARRIFGAVRIFGAIRARVEVRRVFLLRNGRW